VSAIWAERHRPHGAVVTDLKQPLAAGRIPYTGTLVLAASRQTGAIPAEGHGHTARSRQTSIISFLPLATSPTLATLSWLAVARRVPSGLNATP
jgi:hypothetical protein